MPSPTPSTLLLATLLALAACQEAGEPNTDIVEVAGDSTAVAPLQFEQRQIVDDAKLWWALTQGDMDGDGLADLVYIDNNASGGQLAYRRAQRDSGLWGKVVIAEAPPTGGLFAAGDLETGDIDGDGDTDVLAVKHPGEWTDATAPAELFWYEHTDAGWVPHAIGDAKGAVKDMNLGDFDDDGLLDLAVMTFDEENVRVHRHNADGTWTQVADLTLDGIHEGMDVGDLDGDGDLDVAANGYAFANPGGDLTGEWVVTSIDDQWHDQTVHKDEWSLNATKTFVTDLDGDGNNEVFVSHSENAGFPVNYYTRTGDTWEATTILDSLPAAHTLMVYDMDLDGDMDVVTGVNRGRAVNLERGYDADDPGAFPVLVLVNDGSNERFEPQVIAEGGIYNGRVVDYDGDGDMDIFRYPEHQAEALYLLENQAR